jgi:AcrR family transcriptional regulator
MAVTRKRAAPSSPAPSVAAALPMRQQILLVAQDLYVLHGYDGFSFAHIATAVQTTRANIHHHFGDKLQLMAELIEKFASDAEQRIAHHWTLADTSFAERLQAQLDDLRLFYHRFNKDPGARNVWSPLSRLRLDLQVLGALATGALHRVDLAYDRCLRQALRDAIARHEFVASTPIDDLSRLLRVMLLSCAPMTQDSGDFSEIEKLFGAMQRLLFAAWSTQDQQPRGVRVVAKGR